MLILLSIRSWIQIRSDENAMYSTLYDKQLLIKCNFVIKQPLQKARDLIESIKVIKGRIWDRMDKISMNQALG